MKTENKTDNGRDPAAHMTREKYLPLTPPRLPKEVHGADDDWDDFEQVNDPSSGKKLPDEVHACHTTVKGGFAPSSLPDLQTPICVTEKFCQDIQDIYGQFTPSDNEYPAMGITIQGAPIFVECLRFPDCAVTRRSMTDAVERSHPDVGEQWQNTLAGHDGKCRSSTVHIHQMNYPGLSGTDIGNFDFLRTNPDDPSTYATGSPYPVILVNLNAQGALELLGFWIMDGRATEVKVNTVPDDATEVIEAWNKAESLPFFSREFQIARNIDQMVCKGWNVELGAHPVSGEKAIRAKHRDGSKVLLKFTPTAPFALEITGAASELQIEAYMDWSRLLNDISSLPASQKEKEPMGERQGVAEAAGNQIQINRNQPPLDYREKLVSVIKALKRR